MWHHHGSNHDSSHGNNHDTMSPQSKRVGTPAVQPVGKYRLISSILHELSYNPIAFFAIRTFSWCFFP